MNNNQEQKIHESFFLDAAREAQKALCLRARCGAVIVQNGKIVGRGYNAPPQNDVKKRKCELEFTQSRKPKSDRTCCVHAEWRAMVDAVRTVNDLTGSTLYFARVDMEGNLKKSGEPYCTVCSRLALDIGIQYFGLWHEDKMKLYKTAEYNDRSYEFHVKND